jgi:hypothetical protein
LADWLSIQRDTYPAYITWGQYLTNQARLQQNSTLLVQFTEQARGATREGAALLQGLATCGVCGHRMHPAYKSSYRYDCEEAAQRLGAPMCASLYGPSIDKAVVQAFFEAMRPAQLDALEAVLAQQRSERGSLTRQWQQRLTRARYEAQLAQRQYTAADPDNRLVTTELERRWEEKLRELQTVEEEFERFERTPRITTLKPELREQLQHISETLPLLWESEKLTNAERKELLRSLISRVILKRTAQEMVKITIVWVSGHYTISEARSPIRRDREVSGYQALVDRIKQLWQEGVSGDREIAGQLTQEGYHSARMMGVSPGCVLKIGRAHGWQYLMYQGRNREEIAGRLTPRGLAARLGVDLTWVYKRLRAGAIEGKYIERDAHHRMWLIKNEPEVIEQLGQMAPRKSPTQGRYLNG